MKRLFLLMMVALLLTAQQAWADYVTDIMVIGHDSALCVEGIARHHHLVCGDVGVVDP